MQSIHEYHIAASIHFFYSIMNSATVANDTGARQYFLDEEADIIAILRILASEHVPLTIYHEGNTQLASTHILAVNPEFKDVILDAVPGLTLADGLCNASELHVRAYQQQIKIEFKLQRARHMLFQGKPALRVLVPPSLTGMERRENYRTETEALTAATLLILPANQREPQTCRVVDISSGGCAVEVDGAELRFDPGTILSDCVLDLPGVGRLHIAIEIRHSSDFRDGNGLAKRRFGCRFTDTPRSADKMIQRYIEKIDAHKSLISRVH